MSFPGTEYEPSDRAIQVADAMLLLNDGNNIRVILEMFVERVLRVNGERNSGAEYDAAYLLYRLMGKAESELDGENRNGAA